MQSADAQHVPVFCVGKIQGGPDKMLPKTFLIAGNVFAIHKQHIPHLNANFGGNKLSPIPLVSSTHIASEEVL